MDPCTVCCGLEKQSSNREWIEFHTLPSAIAKTAISEGCPFCLTILCALQQAQTESPSYSLHDDVRLVHVLGYAHSYGHLIHQDLGLLVKLSFDGERPELELEIYSRGPQGM